MYFNFIYNYDNREGQGGKEYLILIDYSIINLFILGLGMGLGLCGYGSPYNTAFQFPFKILHTVAFWVLGDILTIGFHLSGYSRASFSFYYDQGYI